MMNIREPKQKRSIEKKRRIMAAAQDLFAEKGIYQTNSKEIAARAGVAIGSFYSYFSDKKALMLEVLDQYLDRHFTAIWAPNPALSLDAPDKDIIRHYLTNLFAAYDMAPGFHRETHALRYSDPEVKQRYDRETIRELSHITSFLTRFRDRIAVKDLEAAAIVIHSAAENLAHKVKFLGSEGRDQQLIDALTDMIFSYLTSGFRENGDRL